MELLVFVSAGEGESPEEFRFESPDRFTLGRGPQSPIPLDGSAVSREHLSLEVRNGAVWATDVSSNGSYFNGRTLTPGAPQLVGPSDELRVGDYILRFRVQQEQPEPSAPSESPAGGARAVTPAPLPLHQRLLSGISLLEWLALLVLLAAIGLIAFWWLQ